MLIKEYGLRIDQEKNQYYLEVIQSFHYENMELNSPGIICDLMKEKYKLQEKADEYVYMICFNQKMKVLGIFEISHGTGSASIMDGRGVFMRAVYVGAQNIMLIHNHPSGEIEISKEDEIMTKRIRDAGLLMGIPLIDHIVIGKGAHYSFHENQKL